MYLGIREIIVTIQQKCAFDRVLLTLFCLGLFANSPLFSQCEAGKLTLERWTGISGSTIANLTSDPDYPNSPDETATITTFQGPISYGNNYGTRVRGYITPPTTGNYIFTVTGDDYTDFYLSTDDDEANKVLVSQIIGWTGITQYTKYPSQTSSSIALVAGTRYYVELLHKEGGGGDHFQVYWQTPTNGTRVIIPETAITSYPCSMSGAFAFSFTESAGPWGIDLDKAKDGGHAFGDFDADGDLDLLINTDHSGRKSSLYENNGASFSNVTASLAPYLSINKRERSAVWGDVNNDGFLDFLRNTSYGGGGNSGEGTIQIFLQDPVSGVFGNGSGGTTPIRVGNTGTNEVNVGFHNTEAVGFIDFDGDGDLDIAFDNHNFGVDILRNNFIDHTTGAVVNPGIGGLFTHATPGAGVVLGLDQSATDGDYGSITDVDDDGWVDLFMRKKNQNDFFLNQGGTFLNGSNIAQADNSNKGAVALYDYDNDGDFDAFWTENDDNQIFRNDGGGVWVALGIATGIPTNFPTTIDEVASGDLDNDGDVDILLVGNNRSYLYINQLNDPILGENVGIPMDFVLDNTQQFNVGENGEATSMIDIDMDGDLDVYMSINNDNNMLWINNLYDASTLEADKDYLFVRVFDNRPAYMQGGAVRPATGAIVSLEDCEGNVISGLREVNGGTGHGTQDPNMVHFGLSRGVDFRYRVIVRYPNHKIGGVTTRTTISKVIIPSQVVSFPITMDFYTDDIDLLCDEICNNGIDDDQDGLIDCFDCGDCYNSGDCADLDGDTISDFCDIDDDNDGIPDSIEIASIFPGVVPDCSSDIDYDFSNGPTLVSGTDLDTGAVYRYDDVAVGVDAFVTIEELNGVTLPTMDDNSADADWFKPQSAFTIATAGTRVYATYLIQFVVANTTTPDIQDAINLSFNDIDGNTNYAEESAAMNPMSFAYDNPTELTITYDEATDWVTGSAGTTEYPGVTNNFPQVNYSFRYRNISEIRIRFGATARLDNASAGGRQHALQFACPTYFTNPQTVAFDLDEDGIDNKDDLDSDNDGIWDATEAGHGEALTSIGRIVGADIGSGDNGLFDVVETTPESDIINYTMSDSELAPDNIYDPYELDSDGDGCYDAFEALVTDPEDDGIAGVGVPVVDANGLVTTWAYQVPLYSFWQDPNYNYCEICKTATINPHILYNRKQN